MIIRSIAAVGLALSVSVAAVAGTCDCKPEITNASAAVTSSCSKIWSSGHCTLKESGASTSRLREQFRGRVSDGVSVLAQTLGEIDTDDPFGGRRDPDQWAHEFNAWEYIRNARTQCIHRGRVDKDDLVMVLIDPVLNFASDNSIGWLIDPQHMSSIIDLAIKHRIGSMVCQADTITRQTINGRTLHFGAGCLAHGNSSAYVITNLGGFEDCIEKILFY